MKILPKLVKRIIKVTLFKYFIKMSQTTFISGMAAIKFLNFLKKVHKFVLKNKHLFGIYVNT